MLSVQEILFPSIFGNVVLTPKQRKGTLRALEGSWDSYFNGLQATWEQQFDCPSCAVSPTIATCKKYWGKQQPLQEGLL